MNGRGYLQAEKILYYTVQFGGKHVYAQVLAKLELSRSFQFSTP